MTEYNRDFTKPGNLKHLGYSFCYFWFSREDSFAHVFKISLCSRCDHLSSKLPHETSITTDRVKQYRKYEIT